MARPPASPFFHPSTPHVVVMQPSPGGTRRPVTKVQEVKEAKSSLVGCTANLVNAIVGSGIVGIPYALQQAGIGAGLILVVLCAFLTDKSLRLLIETAKHVHAGSYEVTAEAGFSSKGFYFVAINMFILSYGAMLSYLMIVKESFSALLGVDPDDLVTKRAVLFAVSLAVMVPLSSQRDMANLSVTSRLSVLIDTVLVGLVAWQAPMAASLAKAGGWYNLVSNDLLHPKTVFVGLGVLSFAFVCQHSAFIIAGSLERPTVRRWSIVTGSSLLLCGCLALTIGISGYVGFGQETGGNILQNLEQHSVAANVGRTMLGITMLFVYPMESFVCRHVAVVLLFSGRRAHEGDDALILNRRDRRIGLTVMLYLAAVIPAAIFEDLGGVLALTGAVGGSCLSYIGPGMCFLGVHGGRFLELVKQGWFGSIMKASLVSATSVLSQEDADTTSNTLLAVEATPLVRNRQEAKQVLKQHLKEAQDFEEMTAFGYLSRSVAWYLSGMPIWCSIAASGKRGLTNHVHELALKSPHPIRIGDVQYTRATVAPGGRVEVDDPEQAMAVVLPPELQLATASDYTYTPLKPMLAQKPPRSPMPIKAGSAIGASMNQQIGQDILKQNLQQNKKVSPPPTEPDPQHEPPTWIDFYWAIFYIIFGVIALFAGLGSILQKQGGGDDSVLLPASP